MRNPAAIGFALLFAALVLTGCKKTLNRNITLSKSDRNPYGAWYAYAQLDWLFPGATVLDNTESPATKSHGNWTQLEWLAEGFKTDSSRALYMVLASTFDPSPEEWEKITAFADAGNSVWLSAGDFGDRLTDSFHLALSSIDSGEANFHTAFLAPADTTTFTYPGFSWHGYFSAFDTAQWQPLARDGHGKVVMIGSRDTTHGHWLLQSTPFAMSNFFLLHRQNKKYYDQLPLFFPEDIDVVVWDNYFRQPFHQKKYDQWSVMTGSAPLRWSLFVGLLAAALYIGSEIKRRQRMIPVVDPLTNSSVDFVKTVGRLYFNRHDNADLSLKMLSHFREQVKARYGLQSADWSAEFEQALVYKSGKPAADVSRLMVQVRQVDALQSISDNDLLALNQSIDQFFKNDN
ncbi:MAG: hypothetical protein QM664_01155 [Flavihumibacter sp.]